MKLTLTAISSVALLAAGFGAGWMANGWRVGEQKAIVERDNTKERLDSATTAYNTVTRRLTEIVTKSEAAAEANSATLAQLSAINLATNKQHDLVTQRTEQMKNEISKLGPAKCVFSIDYGRVWQQVGTSANASRHSLYGTEGKPSN